MSNLSSLTQKEIDSFEAQGVTSAALLQSHPIGIAHGYRDKLGYFEFDPSGPRWFAFPEAGDVVFWCPETGELAWDWGTVFALGQDAIRNPGSTAFGQSLPVHADPLSWLRANRIGIVVLRWEWAFEQLRDVPRLAVDERVIRTYRRNMHARFLPVVTVIRTEGGKHELA